MADKLSIQSEMAALDSKDREWYKSLTPEERKKFSPFLMIRYGASVAGSKELQEYYLLSTNERLNKNFFDVNKYPELQWLLVTTVSPDIGNQRHEWIAAPKKRVDATGSKIRKFLSKLYPSLNNEELALLEKLHDKKDITALATSMGYTPEQIKKELG